MGLLLCLVAHHGETVDRDTLKKAGWPGQQVGEHTLNRTIHSLRELFNDDPREPSFIIAVPRKGYALIAHHEPTGADAPTEQVLPDVLDGRRSLIDRAAALYFEMGRRHVLRVAGTYLVGVWIVLQIAEVTFEPLHFPEWWMTALTILAILGLPVVVTAAWAYEITATGVKRDGRSPTVSLPRARQALAPVIVLGVALMTGVTGYAWWSSLDKTDRGGGRPVDDGTPSIAVLPLNDFSTEADGGYLGDGLSEELSSHLAMVPGLRVASRTSAFAFKGKNVDVRNIGDSLGVRYVLEGSVRRQKDRVRVTVQLIDSLTGYHVWTESYDRPWQDLLQIQQEISSAITSQLRIVLTPEQEEQVQLVSTTDPRAYDFYLAGLSELRQAGALSHLDEAERLFQRSLDADPAFARAFAGLCEAGIIRYQRTKSTEVMADAEVACRKALETGKSLPETELALARLYNSGGQYERAEAILVRLATQNPRDADVRMELGDALRGLGRLEAAEASYREAVAVEPGYWTAHNQLGSFLFAQGRAKEAVEEYARVTELVPGNPTGFNNLGAAQMMTGDLEAAAAAFRRSNEIEPSRSALSNLGTIYYFLGRFDEAVTMYSRAITLAPDDFMLWGSRSDSLWFMKGRRNAAVEGYQRAISLAEQALTVNDSEGVTWSLLGYYYGRVGEQERATRYLERAMEISPDSPFVNYFAALAAADRGDKVESKRLAETAVKNGYPMPLILADPALPAMRSG
jgi:TolB-like protein/tetratricopeptide (TPR) repeat protein